MNPEITSKLTPNEIRALEEFKRRVTKEHGEQIGKDDYQLRRFITAREFDVPKAETMLRNMLTWRKKNNIDRIRQDFIPPEVLQKYLPITKVGFDKEGQNIIYFHFGNMDLKGLLTAGTKADFIKAIFLSVENDLEDQRKNSIKEGKIIEKWDYIFDFENFTFSQATYKEGVEIVMHFLDVYEANYPERLNIVYVVNASIYFTIIFSFVKPVLSGETLRKLRVFGKDGWKEELLKFVSPDVLPTYLGGNIADPTGDSKCSTFLNHGGLVPKSYYLSKEERSLVNKPDVQKYTVQRMSRMAINMEVDKPRSQLEWEFETENYDIGFGINCILARCSENPYKELIPIQKVDTRFMCETGVYTCLEPGVYSLVFDNTFSWIRQKALYCRAYVVTPDGQRICVTTTATQNGKYKKLENSPTSINNEAINT